ncbi:MAG: hypothetical protein AB7V04_07635 [Desulfomonilaceae bacterium]
MRTCSKFCALLLFISAIVTTQAFALPQDMRIPDNDRVYRLIDQIHDLETMQRDIRRRYQVETSASLIGHSQQKPITDGAQLNSELIDRVFGYLAGTPELERFVTIYRMLVLRPSYQHFHSADLFAEYMRLIESARTRITTELNGLLKSIRP